MAYDKSVSVAVSVQPIQRSGYLTITVPRSSPLSPSASTGGEKTFEATESSFMLTDDATRTSVIVRFPNESYPIVPESFRRIRAIARGDFCSEIFHFSTTGSQFVEVISYNETTKETEAAALARPGPFKDGATIVSIKCRTCRCVLWSANSSSSYSSRNMGRAAEMPLLAPEWRTAGSFFCHPTPSTGGGGDEVQPRPGEFVVFPFKLRTNCGKDLNIDTDGGDGAICPECRGLVGMGQDLFLDAIFVETDEGEERDDGTGSAFERLVWAIAKAMPGRVQPLTAILVPVDKRIGEEVDQGGDGVEDVVLKQDILVLKVIPGRLVHFEDTRELPTGAVEYIDTEFVPGVRVFWRKGTLDEETQVADPFVGVAPVVPIGRRGFDEVVDQLTELARIQGSDVGGGKLSLVSVRF